MQILAQLHDCAGRYQQSRRGSITGTNHESNERIFDSRATLGLCLFLAIAAFFLWTEHRAHVLGILPYLILAACPVIHLFMHRRHHRNDGGTSANGTTHRHRDAS